MRYALIAFVLVSGVARADTVYLEGGGKLEGVVVGRTDRTLELEMGPGRVGIPLSRVVKVVPSSSPLSEYRRRAQALPREDVAAWLELADWAQGSDLKTQASEACEHVLRIDPANARAQRCVGHVLYDGQWMTFDDSQRARGLIQYGSRWVTAAEQEQLVAAESSADLARKAQQEAEARVREAEARAREAEARAQVAESDSGSGGAGFGVWPLGGGGFCNGGCGPGCARACDAPASHDGSSRRGARSGHRRGASVPPAPTRDPPRTRSDSPAPAPPPPASRGVKPRQPFSNPQNH